MKEDKLLKVIYEIVSLILYQPNFPQQHKEDLAKAYSEFRKSCKANRKGASK